MPLAGSMRAGSTTRGSMSPRLVCSCSRYSAERLKYEPPMASRPMLPDQALVSPSPAYWPPCEYAQACRRRNSLLDDVDDAGDGVGAVGGRGAFGEHFDVIDRTRSGTKLRSTPAPPWYGPPRMARLEVVCRRLPFTSTSV